MPTPQNDAIVTATSTPREVTPTNPLIINSAIGDYGDVVIAGGDIQVVVPTTQTKFTSLSKTS
jgi:hypothetical protein